MCSSVSGRRGRGPGGKPGKLARQQGVGVRRGSRHGLGQTLNRLERLYAVAEEIRRHAPAPVTAGRLAGRFEVSRRTIERDLAALREAGVPVRAAEGRGGGHALDPTPIRAVLSFTAAEVTALLLALRVAEGMPFTAAARAAAARLADTLPPATRVHVDQLRTRIRVVPGPAATPAGTVRPVVEEAVRRGLVVRLDYTDRAGRDTTRDVDAVGFYGTPDGWALVGWCHLRAAGRQFRLDRIRRAILTSRPATHHDLDEALGWVPDPGDTPG